MKHSTWHFFGAHGVCAAIGLAAFFTPKTAHAFDLGIGLIGAAGGNFLDKPSRTTFEPDIYPGFAGLTIGGGLMLDGRILGRPPRAQVDLIRSSDKGSGSVTSNGVKLDVKLGQAAWHLPILAKLVIPLPLIAPEFFLGPEIVFPSKSNPGVSVSVPLPPGLDPNSLVHQTASTYVMITGGVGIEIKVPLPVVDLRIPVGLRLSYAPGVSSKFADRVHTDTTGTTFQSEWKFAVNATAGAAIYF